MKITSKRLLKYFYIGIISIWLIISFHVIYLYIFQSSEQKPVKGGTLVEVGVQPINFLPYISNTKKDILYQSFLFNGCLKPFVDGTKIAYKEDLCKITTQNYENFTVKIKENNFWSNGNPVTLDDVYFTYKKILKDNIWKLDGIEKYENLEIKKKEDSLTVSFPSESKDNMIFFSKLILPHEELANSKPSEYISKFRKNPVTTDCGEIKKDVDDANSIVFNLSECKDMYINYYQYKKFQNFENLKEYIKGNQNIVDYYIGDQSLTGYEEQKIILNKFIGIFFNTSSEIVDKKLRRSFTNFLKKDFYNQNSKQFIIKDQFLFNSDIEGEEIQKTIKAKEKELSQPEIIERDLPSPENISLNGTGNKEYLLNELEGEYSVNLNFSTGAERISVSYENTGEYFLTEYQNGSNTATYNISKTFNNAENGKNTYTVRGYSGGNQAREKEIIIHIGKQPTKKVMPETDELNLQVIYNKNEVNNYIIQRVRELLRKKGIEEYFSFEGYETSEKFRGKLSSKNYDITLRGINMGLKKDISNIFKTQNPLINPSLYINNELAALINQYFKTPSDNSKEKIKNEIDKIYSQDIPFFLFGKKYGYINVNESLDFSFPKRLYDYQFRGNYLDEIKMKKGLKINKKQLLKTDNFINFIKESLN